jgi:hypothetical protein
MEEATVPAKVGGIKMVPPKVSFRFPVQKRFQFGVEWEK